MPHLSPWTPELDALLRAARATGATDSEIGRRLGVSRNAVAGRAYRLGIKAPEENMKVPPAPETGRYTLLDLPTEGCRWPYGDGPFTFCGELVDRSGPYCPGHRAKAHNKMEDDRISQEASRSGRRATVQAGRPPQSNTDPRRVT